MKGELKAREQALERALKERSVLMVQNEKLSDALKEALKELAFQNEEMGKRASELGIANIALAFHDDEKLKRANELILANKELIFETEEKRKRATDLATANKEILFENGQKARHAIELEKVNKELSFQTEEKRKRAKELIEAYKELLFQNEEKEILKEKMAVINDTVMHSSQYARSLIESSLDPLVTISAEGKITDVNEASVLVTGLCREELIGTDFSHYFTEPDIAQQGFKLVFEEGSISDYPLTIKHKNGQLKDVLYNASVYRNDEGQVLGVFAAARDVTKQKRANAALDKSLKEISAFKFALEQAISVDITDSKGKIMFVNDKYCELSKYSREELIGHDNRMVNSGFHEAAFIKGIWDTIKAGKKWRGEIKNRAKDGTLYWVDTTIVPCMDADEKIYQYIALKIDITSKKNQSFYSRSLIEASRDPLITISSEGIITDMNEAMVRVTGVGREMLKGSEFKNYFTEPEKASKIYKEVFEKGFVVDFPLTIIDGKLTDVLFNGAVYKDEEGDVLGAVIVARDITEQKRIAKELTEAKVLAELATSFAEDAKEKAETAVKAKQQFLSNMSHEIRTPMNAIIGFTKVVLKTELTAKQKEYLMAIKMSGDTMIVLINDILDLAKVDAGKMSFEKIPFRLENSINSMTHLFETKIQEKNLVLVKQYDARIPEILLGDPVRLNQIILNLVSNAVKFTTKGTITISVKLLTETEENASIEFAVSDTGIGIAPSKIGQIFDNFQQASTSTSRLFGGTGLGLAIVKQLVEQQGGQIQVESELEKGSRLSFILDFPKSKEEPEFDQSIEEPKKGIKNIKVLVVEDMALNQLLMKTLLEDYGFEHDIAANGLIAIEKMKQKDYDIILMDLQMPEMNGFEATDYIRTSLKSRIPIIALTADVTTVDLAKCRAVGMNDYIAKPVEDRLLYSKIIGLVKKPVIVISENPELIEPQESKKNRCTDLDYLNQRTRSNSKLMLEMIGLYLEQTPRLIQSIKQGWTDKNWELLNAAIHKIIPSFLIMGINSEYEMMARKVQEFAMSQKQIEGIHEMVLQIEKICVQACSELEEEIKNHKYHQ